MARAARRYDIRKGTAPSLLRELRVRNVRMRHGDGRLGLTEVAPFDAIVLAAAGLRRLGFGGRISFTLPAGVCVPAPGQGIVAIETRARDDATRAWVARISDPAAAAALDAERAVVEALGGGCQTPIGALAAAVDGGALELVGVVASLDGRRVLRATARAGRTDARELGQRVGHDLIAKGASEILSEVRAQ